MPYSTKELVSQDFKDITFAPGKLISDTDVETFIEEADALIDSKIGVRYEVPIADESLQGFKLLQYISRTIVSQRIKGILEVKDASKIDDTKINVKTGMSYSDAMKLLEQIAKGEMSLIGVEPLLGGVASYAESHCVKPVFDKDKVQW